MFWAFVLCFCSSVFVSRTQIPSQRKGEERKRICVRVTYERKEKMCVRGRGEGGVRLVWLLDFCLGGKRR